MSINIQGPLPRWLTLCIVAIIGLALIVVPRIALQAYPIVIEISEGTGIALLTSAILAFTVERWLRSDLTKDIFREAIGHHLPPNYRNALQGEIIRLSTYDFLCEDHILLITIQSVDDNCVLVTTKIERVIRNITQSSQNIGNYVHVDEWGFPQPSQIYECSIQKLDGAGKDHANFTKTVQHDDLSISATTKTIKLGPNERAKLLSKFCEVKRATDDLSLVFMSPTTNPTIEIQVPSDTFRFKVSFGPDEEVARKEEYSTRQTLNGMYWPLQRMRVKWWRIKVGGETGTPR